MRLTVLLPAILVMANSGYLAYSYAAGFQTGTYAAALASQFTLPLLSLPFFFLFLLLLQNLKEKTFSYKGSYALPNLLLRFGFYAILILFVTAFGFLLFKKATENGAQNLRIVLPVFAEVIGLLWITAQTKTQKVKNQLWVLALWTGSILSGFIIIGVAAKIFHRTYTNEERLLFSGIFFMVQILFIRFGRPIRFLEVSILLRGVAFSKPGFMKFFLYWKNGTSVFLRR